MRGSQLDEPIPCMVWSESGTELRIEGGEEVASRSLPPGWQIGFYERLTVPASFIREVGSIQLVVEPHFWLRLEGDILDAVSGRLAVLPPNNAPQATRETRA
jgi:hypothetical protein